MTRLASSELRDNLADTLNRVAYKRERVVLKRRVKDVAALVPLEDLELLRQVEDRIDLDAAREALGDSGATSWKKVKARLGLRREVYRR